MNEMRATVLGLVLVGLLAGCSSTPKPRLSRAEIKKVDWSQRVGTYTWAEAMADLGKPDVMGDQSDKKFGEWVLNRKNRMGLGFGVGGGSFGGGTGVGVGVGSEVPVSTQGDVLRLEFDPAGKLTQWSRIHY